MEPTTPPFNKQLYVNSGLKELFADSLPDGVNPVPKNGFFNPREPNLAILHEKPEHRLLMWMKAQGASNREIAQQAGYTDAWISQLMRQPWAQKTLVEMMTEAGMDITQQLLKSACPDSVLKLIDLRDDPKTPPAVVRASCVDLIQQYLGKPKQQVEIQSKNQTNLKVEELDKELARLDSETNRLLGVT